MNAQSQWDRIESALDEILALPEGEWPAACARIAGNDAALLAEIRSLLACTGGDDPVLDRPVPEPEEPAPTATGLAAGTRVGAYRVIELIGRGGMGEVYRAARADGQYQQEVALKLIRNELTERPERFQVERQILAQLDHPGIARLLDGGVFDGSMPYMALELVKGLPITEWCRKNRCGLNQRLQLFIAVCDAVAHAHRSLVVHRDIKPGNVLVTDDGAVKLLDFGVAKLLSAAPGDATRNAPMTPAYSAPEQLTGGAITTATDVYALGILLFELLAGELPWKSHGMPFGVAVRKILSETEPVLSRAARDAAAPPVPWTLLRGDLDAIVSKSLRKQPAHRYLTVNALREDVARVLRHEPVAAREGARLYVISRFVRRQRVLVASAAVIVMVIVAGLVGVAWQAREALQQAHRAELESRKATAVKDFLLDIFKQSSIQNPGGVEAKKLTAEQLLDIGATRITSQLHDQPAVREELMDTLAELNDDLGLTDRAKSLAADNLAELQSRTGNHPSAAVAKLDIRLAITLVNRNELSDAGNHLHTALDNLRSVGEADSVDAAAVYFQLGRAAYDGTRENRAAGVRDLDKALDILKRRDPANPMQGDVLEYLARYAKVDEDFTGAERWLNASLAFQEAQGMERNSFSIGEAYHVLGDLQSLMRRFDVAEPNLRQAIALLSRAAGPDHPETADALARLGEMLFYEGHRSDAAELLNEALKAQLTTAQGTNDATETRKTLGSLEYTRGRLTAAERVLRENLAQMKGLPDKELRYGISCAHLSLVLAAQGQVTQAREMHAVSLGVYKRFRGEKSRAYAEDLTRGGSIEIAARNPAEAVLLYDRVLQDFTPQPGEFPASYTRAVLGLAAADLDLGKIDDARRTADDLLQRIAAHVRPAELVEQEAQGRRLKGEALRRAGKLAEAEVELRRAVELREALDDADSPWLAQVRINLAKCLIARHLPDEAGALLSLAAAAQAHQPLLSEFYRQELREANAQLKGR